MKRSKHIITRIKCHNKKSKAKYRITLYAETLLQISSHYLEVYYKDRYILKQNSKLSMLSLAIFQIYFGCLILVYNRLPWIPLGKEIF